jgi:hypothetical protein
MRRILRNAASVSLEDYTPVLKGLLGSGSFFQELFTRTLCAPDAGAVNPTAELTVGCPRWEGVLAEHWEVWHFLPF